MSKPKNAILHETPEFVEFWEIWRPICRRTDGRLDAKDGFNKMVAEGADPRDIIDGARWYVRNLPARYEYVPLAKTWLNRGGWMDDCESERAFLARQAERADPANVVNIRPTFPKSAFLREYEQQKKQQG